MKRSNLFWLIVNFVAIAALAMVGPAEKSLGFNVRVVYLHGAWVWTALAGFVAAAACGLVGLLSRQIALQRWSRAWGRTGLLFWISYLPLSMWAMQTNWNGMFLAEPRFRMAAVFAIGGLLLQIGITIAENPAWACGGNLVYALALFWALANTPNVLHPASPILSSDAWRIQAYFFALLTLTLLLAVQVARLWRQADRLEFYKFERLVD
jgi:hypothetical protein